VGNINYEGIILPGEYAICETTVGPENTARAVCSGGIDVFATPMMIALMESAGCDCLQKFLENGITSVGTKVNIEHTAASPIGAKITATATVVSVSGRMVELQVSAKDDTREIGRGTHTRAIIHIDKFMAKLNR